MLYMMGAEARVVRTMVVETRSMQVLNSEAYEATLRAVGKDPSRRAKLERRGSLVPSTQATTWSTARKVRVGVTMLLTVTKARIDFTLSPFIPPKVTCKVIRKKAGSFTS